jgi:hypothetical protein
MIVEGSGEQVLNGGAYYIQIFVKKAFGTKFNTECFAGGSFCLVST